MSSLLKEAALKREVELLWVVAEDEKNRANALEQELLDCQAALAAAQNELARTNEELRTSQSRLATVSTELERRATGLQDELLLLQRAAATSSDESHRQWQQDRVRLVAERDEALERCEATAVLLRRVTSELLPSIWRECDGSLHSVNDFVSDAVYEAGRATLALNRRSSAALQEMTDQASAWCHGVQRCLEEHLHRRLVAAARPFTELSLERCLRWMSSVVEAALDHNAAVLDATVAPCSSSSRAMVARNLAVDSLSWTSTPGVDDLQVEVLALERRLAARDQLATALRRRAEAAEDRVATLDAEVETLQQRCRDAERVSSTALQELSEQKELVVSLRSAFVSDRRSSRNASGAALDGHGNSGGSEVDDEETSATALGRRQATEVLKDQLERQLHLLRKIEDSERHVAQAHAAGLVSRSLTEIFARIGTSLVEAHQEGLTELCDAWEDERLLVVSELERAAAVMEDVARRRRQMELLDEAGQSAAWKSTFQLDVPFQLISCSSLFDVLSNGSHDYENAGLGASGLGMSWSTTMAMRRSQRAPQQQHHNHHRGSASRAQDEVVLSPMALHVAASVAALFLEVKQEFCALTTQQLAVLHRAFWVLAPKHAAASHVRIHILEGALAVSEAQRIQALTVAQWLEQSCLTAKHELEGLLDRHRTTLLPWDGGAAATRGGEFGSSVTTAGSTTTTNNVSTFSTNPANGRGTNTFRAASPVDLSAQSPGFMSASGAFGAGDLSTLSGSALQAASATDRKVAKDLAFARETCERVVDVLTAHQQRLVDAEMQLQETTSQLESSISETTELRLVVQRTELTHLVEQQLADDTIHALRGMLTEERAAGLESMRSLIACCVAQNEAILALRADRQALRLLTSGLLLAAQYIFNAFCVSEARCGSLCVGAGRLLRSACLGNVDDVTFNLLGLHWEYGAILSEATSLTYAQFHALRQSVKQVHDCNYELRVDLQHASAAASLLLQQREVESNGVRMLFDFVSEGAVQFSVALKRDLMSILQECFSELESAVNLRARCEAERNTLRQQLGETVRALSASERQLDEHRVALGSSAEAVTALERLLSDKMGALRGKEIALDEHLARASEQTALLRTLQDQLIVYHALHSQLEGEKNAAETRAVRSDEICWRLEDERAKALEELAKVSEQLDRERAAHRHTIRSIAAQLVTEPSADQPPSSPEVRSVP